MNMYLLTFKSFRPINVIANDIIQAIDKYKTYCINKDLDGKNRLKDMTSIKLIIEGFDYIL